jgi:Na+/H+-dicarboxylate symporter
MRRIPLPAKILLGFLAGALWGVLHPAMGLEEFTAAWIAPLGTLFLNLLKLVALPLVVVSLLEGIATVGSLSRLSRLGGLTLATTCSPPLWQSSSALALPAHSVRGRW